MNKFKKCFKCGKMKKDCIFIDNEIICNNCLDTITFWDDITLDKRGKLSGSEMTEKMKSLIKGQDKALKKLISVVLQYDKISRYNEEMEGESEKTGKPFSKISNPNAVIIGDTGTGKTESLKVIEKILGMPVLFADGSQYTRAGFVGNSVQDLVEQIASKKKNNRLIVFIDEADKMVNKKHGTEIQGESVQNEFLALISGAKFQHQNKPVDTSDVLFILAGSHADIKDIVRKRISNSSNFGFNSNPDDNSKKPNQILHEDLISFGYTPELAGRISNIIVFNSLSESEFRDIIKEKYIPNYIDMYKKDSVNLTFREDAIDSMAKMAKKANIGIRGVQKVLINIIGNIEYYISDNIISDKNNTIEITPEHIKKISSADWFKDDYLKKYIDDFKASLTFKSIEKIDFETCVEGKCDD